MYDSWALIIAAPPALVALAVALDRRSQRGYGLGLLAAGTLALDVWGISAFFPAAQLISASHTDDLGFGLILAAYLLIGLYFALAMALGAIVETVIARQWRWLAIIATVSVVPAVIILAPGTALVPDVLGALGIPRFGEAAILLLSPVLITFAYAIARTIQRPLAL